MGTEFFGCAIPSKNDSAALNEIIPFEAHRIFEILKPKPSPYPLIRIGNGSDGSYLVPNDLNGISGCLTPGVNNYKHFEDELANTYTISSDMLDGSSDQGCLATPLIRNLQTFSKMWLDTEGTSNSISIGQWLQSKNPTDRDFILQMDIEGAEYRNILLTEETDLARFRIIILELHRVAVGFSRPRVFNHVLKPFLEKLSKDFVCVHSHPNNVTCAYRPASLGIEVPNILEITLLRRDRLKTGKKQTLNRVRLPHPFDITNVPGRLPLTLGKDWLSEPRATASRIKIFHDWLQLYRIHKDHGNATGLFTAQIKRLIKNGLSDQQKKPVFHRQHQNRSHD